ncbi:protein of unknown function [Candidatus Hydrogenisulfobacillus filiaventi]|uniref:Uncharacterized protein n=1 Tax=Candidatus Hydrogenisulfobacillus filiaventi TaxID=2707344 RepID=A0A6F8ZIX0_9FIRM|nr:hypothetical protein [Bacillota bacterium]CAB1129675.1 protein of unknown function [Candidatus Hydrogenisulfobacillus filiaventi]
MGGWVAALLAFDAALLLGLIAVLLRVERRLERLEKVRRPRRRSNGGRRLS